MESREALRRLGRGETIESVCAAAGWTRAQFDAWWGEECRARVPRADGTLKLPGLRQGVRIRRDRWGVPHIEADNDHDLFFGFGYATAQDRLFQLDYLRRKAHGRLAEVLGKEAVESDVFYRTAGLSQVAAREWDALPAETRALTEAYSAGVNALIEQTRERPAIEFDLLEYRPEPWTPLDSLVIVGEFRWYLTVRFPVIVIPELAKRTLGPGPLFDQFVLGEEDAESILRPGEYPASHRASASNTSSGADAGGSNNWVLAGTRTVTGKPLVANDPHVPYYAVSIWHEVVLNGGSFQVAGVALAGMPAVMIGRSRRVAWGITNNICSLRDLYQEKSDPQHPGCFFYDGKWEPERRREEEIQVRGGQSVKVTVRSSRNGPIVDDILPPQARTTGPVSLRWLGYEPCGWLTALLDMGRARTCAEFRAATRPWLVPTFNLVFADADGHIGLQTVGRIPLRAVPERGYRPGWDPQHQWTGFIPFEHMPHLEDPARGFVVTANNRLAPDDFPYPLSGRWSVGHRARRIREVLEGKSRWSRADFHDLHQDVYSARAAQAVPGLLKLLAGEKDPLLCRALDCLRSWDYHVRADAVAPAIFHLFFTHWCKTVAAERFPPAWAGFMSANANGVAVRLLQGEAAEWFQTKSLAEVVRDALRATVAELTTKLGPNLDEWRWGRLHMLLQKHFLSGRGDLGQLLDRSGLPLKGDATTVFSNTPDPSHAAWLGAGYRMIADFADPAGGLWQIDVGSVSGHPGSPHYDDQLTPWSAAEYHYLSFDPVAEGKTLELLAS